MSGVASGSVRTRSGESKNHKSTLVPRRLLMERLPPSCAASVKSGASSPTLITSIQLGRLIQLDRLIQQGAELRQRGCASWIVGRECECTFKFVDRAFHHPLGSVDSTQVHERIMTRIVTRRGLGLLEPLDRLVEFALGD